jgi:hypothetical protein
MRVAIAVLLSLWFVQPVWGESHGTWSPHPGSAEARAQALMHPKSAIEEPGAPRYWGNSEGTGAGAPVPGTGQAPRFLGQAPFPSREEAPPAATGGAPAGKRTTP